MSFFKSACQNCLGDASCVKDLDLRSFEKVVVMEAHMRSLQPSLVRLQLLKAMMPQNEHVKRVSNIVAREYFTALGTQANDAVSPTVLNVMQILADFYNVQQKRVVHDKLFGLCVRIKCSNGVIVTSHSPFFVVCERKCADELTQCVHKLFASDAD